MANPKGANVPIDIIVPANSLDQQKVSRLVLDLTESLLKWTDASEDATIRANVAVFLHQLPLESVNAAGEPANVARVDVKLPSVALSTQDRRAGFIAEATALVQAAAAPEQPFERVWVFVSHAVDGGWGIDGRAFEPDDFGD